MLGAIREMLQFTYLACLFFYPFPSLYLYPQAHHRHAQSHVPAQAEMYNNVKLLGRQIFEVGDKKG